VKTHCDKGKGKVVPVLFFYWAPRLKVILGKWRYSSTHSWPRKYMGMVSFTPRPLYPNGKSPWYTLDKRL